MEFKKKAIVKFRISTLENSYIPRFIKAKQFKTSGSYFLKKGILGAEFKKKLSNLESRPLKTSAYRLSFKTKDFEVSKSNLPK